MTESEIESALRTKLAGLAGLPTIIWPNQDAMPVPPYIVVEIVRFPVVRQSLGGTHSLTGLLQASVLIAKGRFNSEAKAYADIIVAGIPADTKITAGSGSIRITRRPQIMTGYDDPAIAAWRLPVQVEYRGFA